MRVERIAQRVVTRNFGKNVLDYLDGSLEERVQLAVAYLHLEGLALCQGIGSDANNVKKIPVLLTCSKQLFEVKIIM